MKRFLRRLIIVIIISSLLVCGCYLLRRVFTEKTDFNILVLVVGILSGLFIRVIDDYFDYYEDVKRGKKVLPRQVYFFLGLICFIILSALSFYLKNFLIFGYLTLTLLFLQPILLPKICFYFRVFIFPFWFRMIFTLFDTFDFPKYQIISCLLCLVIGIIFAIRRKKNENYHLERSV